MKLTASACLFGAFLEVAFGSPVVNARAPKGYVQDAPTDYKGAKHLRPVLEKRQAQNPSYETGQPYDPASKKGSIFSGGTNAELDLQNPENLGAESTDNGAVVNLKWSFSDSHVRLSSGGWTREQVGCPSGS